MFARLRIGQKLLLVNALSALVVLSLAGGLLIWRNHTDLESRFAQRIEQESVLVASNAVAAVLFEDWENAREIASALLQDAAIKHVELSDSVDEEMVSLGVEASQDKSLLHVSVPVMDGDTAIARLDVYATNAEVWTASARSLSYILAITFLASMAGLLISNRVQRLVTEPITRLSELVRDVRASKRYGLRAQPVYPDEVGTLAEDLNAMMAIIEARDRDLELTVEARTAALKEEMAQRQQSDQARAEIQQRFEKAFEYAPIGMAIVAPDGHLLQRNHTFDEIFQTAQQDVRNVADLLDEASWAKLKPSVESLVKGDLTSVEGEVEGHTRNDTDVVVETSIASIRSEDGQHLYAVLQVKDVTDARRLAAELEHQARHDVLTGLANRRTLNQALVAANEACREEGRVYSLCILDLDQFKVVNDTSGHAAGDALLMQIAQVLRESVRPEDIIVRLGGDEFALLLPGCPGHKSLAIANEIREQVEALVFHWEGTTHHVGVSIGVICITIPSEDISDVMQRADAACFAAKEAGRNNVHMVTDSSAQVEEKRGEMHWVQRLHKAIGEDEFLLYAQPVVPLKANEPWERLEVLVRLRNFATGQLVPPGAFLPSAERYGLSVKIDRWVTRTLLQQASIYRALFDEKRQYWINLTGSSFGDREFMSELVDMLEKAALPEGSINFEITETTVVRNLKEATRVIEQLRGLGCRFALDDFGKGLSSFGYLKSLPVDTLKIDGMFVRDIHTDEIDRMFVKAIIEIAHAMGMTTVAEFIEDADVLAHVKALGADYGQGFMLGRPKLLLPQNANGRDAEVLNIA